MCTPLKQVINMCDSLLHDFVGPFLHNLLREIHAVRGELYLYEEMMVNEDEYKKSAMFEGIRDALLAFDPEFDPDNLDGFRIEGDEDEDEN